MQRLPRHVLYLAIAVSTLLFLPSLRAILRANFDNLVTARALLRNEDADEGVPHEASTVACTSYPRAVQFILSPSLTGAEQLQRSSTVAKCLPPERLRLLLPLQATKLADLGAHTDACAILVSTGNARTWERLAEAARRRQDYHAIATYLNCGLKLIENNTGVSRARLARLNNDLGRYYRQQGRTAEAIAFFRAAADWSPEIWAPPLTSMAQLLGQQGRSDEARHVIADALLKSSDIAANFQLWLTLAAVLKEEGNPAPAYCSYLEAQRLSSILPENRVPANARQTIAVQLGQLEPLLRGQQPVCPDLRSYLQDP